MALLKNDIPILEYDDCAEAVVKTNNDGVSCFPPKAVFAFLADEVEKFGRENSCEIICEFESSTKMYPIYKLQYKGQELCLCQAPVGAAAAAQILDYLIGHGVCEIISAGSCGALVDLPENEFLIPTQALRCEGTSYHYLPPARTIELNRRGIEAIERAMDKNSIGYAQCKTWTTDGFFRETPQMVEYRRQEGFSVVEMECSALAACAEFRGVIFGQMLFTADTLADVENHCCRDWGKSSLPIALKLCFDAVIEL